MTNPNFEISRSKYPWLDKECSKCKLYWPLYMCYWCAWVQKLHSVSVCDQLFLSYRPFWDKCTELPPNDLKPYNVKDAIFLPWVSKSPKFHSVSLYDEPFLSYRPFWEKCTQWALNDLEHYKLKCTPYVPLVSLVPSFHSVLLYSQPPMRYRAFWYKCTEWPQNDLEPYKIKCTPYMYSYNPSVSNFTPFHSTTSHF